jgi:hypothetical protein
MKLMKKYLIAGLLSLPLTSMAQDAYTLKFLPELQQSQWVNASNQSDIKLSLGLPVLSGVSFYLFNSGFTYNSLFHRVNDSTMAIHPDDFIDKLKNRNLIAFGANVSLLSLNLGFEDFTVGFSVTDKADFRFSYPKDLFKFAWYGNGAYIGKTLDIGNFGVKASWYREYALHGTYNYGKWTFGASPKLLFGKTNINTRASSLKLYTEPDYYAITATTEMDIQTSGIADSTDKAQGNMSFPGYAFNNQNRGLGIDLGAKYEIDEHIDVSAGINNLGFINWKSNVHNYTAGPTSFTFDGFNLENLFQGDTNFISTDQYVDSVTQLVKFDKNNNSYRTSLPTEFYVMGNYHLGRMHTFGAQLNAQRFSKKMVFATTLAYRIHVNKHLTGALSYTMKSSSAFNLGGAIIVNYGGAQLYFATDNWWAALKPLDSKNTNLHMGINAVIGDRAKKKSELHPIELPGMVDRPVSERTFEEDEEGEDAPAHSHEVGTPKPSGEDNQIFD